MGEGGGDLEIMVSVWKLLKVACAHKNFLKVQLELVNLRKRAPFT